MEKQLLTIDPLSQQYKNLKEKIFNTKKFLGEQQNSMQIYKNSQLTHSAIQKLPVINSKSEDALKQYDFSRHAILEVNYDQQEGFYIMFDFINSLPVNFQEIALTYTIINKYSSMDDVDPKLTFSTLPFYTEKESPYTKKIIMKEKSKLLQIPYNVDSILFITLHAWEVGEIKLDENTCFKCWTLYELFSLKHKINAGKIKLPFFSQGYNHHVFYTKEKMVALPEATLNMRVVPLRQIELQTNYILHESQYKYPEFISSRVSLTEYKATPNNIGRVPDGLGRPILREQKWDNSVAELLHKKKIDHKEETETLKNEIIAEKNRLQGKLQMLYDEIDQQEDFTSNKPELDITLHKLNNYIEEEYITYSFEIVFLENQEIESAEILTKVNSEELFEPYIRKKQVSLERSYDLKLDLNKLLAKYISLQYYNGVLVIFKFYQNLRGNLHQEFAWFIHPLFDRQKRYNFGKFRKKLYEYPLPKYFPIDYQRLNIRESSFTFSLSNHVRIEYNDPFYSYQEQQQQIQLIKKQQEIEYQKLLKENLKLEKKHSIVQNRGDLKYYEDLSDLSVSNQSQQQLKRQSIDSKFSDDKDFAYSVTDQNLENNLVDNFSNDDAFYES